MDLDVLIIGGSFAGLAAAMPLARARRRVRVLDSGQPRNRFAAQSHGFPGQDGRSPAQILATFRQELTAYPTATLQEGRATTVSRRDKGFAVTLADGSGISARRLVLAYGMQDSLPDLPGLRERWGATVLHCPYCHGYEVNQQPAGILARNEIALHQAMLIPDWGPTTLFTQGTLSLSDDQRQALTARGVTIEETPVTALLGPAPALEAVQLDDGRKQPLAALYTTSDSRPASDLADQLGCTMAEGPTGPYLKVDGMQASSVPGVFAAGDLCSPMINAVLSASSGMMAGTAAHRSLIFPPELAPA